MILLWEIGLMWISKEFIVFFHFLLSFFHHLASDDPALLEENWVRFFSANFCSILGTIYDHVSAFLEGVVANFVHKMRLHDVSHFVIFCQFWTITPIFQPNLAKICYNSKKISWNVFCKFSSMPEKNSNFLFRKNALPSSAAAQKGFLGQGRTLGTIP